MTGNVAFTDAVYRVAHECAFRRNTGRCKEQFCSHECNGCPHFMGEYVDIEPRQMKLYMYKMDGDMILFMQNHRSINRYFWAAIILIVLVFIFL